MASARSTEDTVRGLDPVAVDAIVRRLARAAEPPWLHREIARRMAERLAVVRLQPETVIDWCSHLGAGADLLAAAYPKARRIAVEPTDALVERSLAAARKPWWSPQRWGGRPLVVKQGEALPDRAQLVWANMMLHAVADPPALFEGWQRLLDVGGFVMFSCFGPGTLRELHAIYRRAGWGAPTPAFVDMHDLGDMLVHAGFADPVMDQEVLTLHWQDAVALLNELRALGGNAAPDRHAGLRTPRWRERLLHELAACAGPDGRPGLRFEIAYGHAFRAAPRARVAQATSVPLEDMRTMVRTGRPKPSG